MCSGTSTLPQGASLSAGWLHEPQPTINQLLIVVSRVEVSTFHTFLSGFDQGVFVCVQGLREL